jgi:diguanylate cyclase (GGDEF)-like protein
VQVLGRTSAQARLRLLLAVAVLTIAGSVWLVSDVQRESADAAYAESAAGQRMFVAMLSQQTGLRGFALTRREEFLEPFRLGVREFEQALRDAGALARHDRGKRDLTLQAATAREWRSMAMAEISRLRAGPGRRKAAGTAVSRKRAFDRFRTQNLRLQRDLDEERTAKLDRAGLVSVAVILLVAFFFFGVSYFVIERQARAARERRDRERAYKRSQTEFAETMQVMRSEQEAHSLVKSHLERWVYGARVVVLNRNASSDRLEAMTSVSEDSPLANTLLDAEPASCLAVRLAAPYRQSQGDKRLLSCGLCGATGAAVTCVPSLVSGEVIGSVNVQHATIPSPEEGERVSDSVTQAAPVLAHLRNLALAEARAATDALTGLPNKRACADTLKRMVAHAGRSLSPLSALLLDLDHFKRVNDTFGHGVGDDALAAVGEAISANLRTSDFAGRYGGEEFLVLLPDTDHAGAGLAAEKLRATVARIEVPGLERQMTASLGLACYPLDAGDGDTLIRLADRALYAAKNAGRNRVEQAVGSAAGVTPGSPSRA